MKRNEIDIAAFIKLLRRQSRIFAVTLVAVLALGAVYALSITPKYEGVATVEIQPKREVLSDSVSINNLGAISAAIDGEVRIILSNDVLLA